MTRKKQWIEFLISIELRFAGIFFGHTYTENTSFFEKKNWLQRKKRDTYLVTVYSILFICNRFENHTRCACLLYELQVYNEAKWNNKPYKLYVGMW